MKRPRPTRQLLTELCAGDDPNYQGLIASTQHGLNEVSMSDFYPFLDLDEVVAFAASSWQARDRRDDERFSALVNSGNVYDLFSHVYGIGVPWLAKHRRVSVGNRELYDRLNPFGGRGLRERLTQVDGLSDAMLRDALVRSTNRYVFECQYNETKRMRGGDNSDLVVMDFQNVYPKRGRIVPAFACEVARVLSGYSREYDPAPRRISRATATGSETTDPVQGNLF